MVKRRGVLMKSFLIRFINKKASKLTHHSGFTLGELTIALVVVTLVVMVTLPITLSKMKKVDYISYYMGYTAVKDLAVNVLPDILDMVLESDESENPCAFEPGGTCFGAPFFPTPITKAECEAEKSNLGIKECSSENDYWAGAVKACGGVSKMPTMAQVAEIANYVYNTSGIGAKEDVYNLTLDYDKAAELGFTVPQGSPFLVWSGEEYLSSDAYSRRFYSTYTHRYNYNRGASGLQAVCPASEDDVSGDYNEVLCDKIAEKYNLKDSDCSITPESVQSKVTSKNFSELTPNITYANGLMLYIGSDLEDIADLSDAESTDDRKGFVVYIDVNGSSGKGKLWQDVFPFYLLKSGKVLPAYDDDLIAGANNTENLSVNVLYDNYSGDNREIKLLLSDANFRSAACVTGYIKSAKYCDGKTQYDLCKKEYHDCRMIVKEPVKLF